MYSPEEIAKNYVDIAKRKTSLVWYKALLLGILAGVYIAFGAAASTVASASFSGSAAQLIKGAVFPVGLILVVICGAELFTGNCLLFSPLIGKDIKLGATLKNWGIVYLGNFVGAVLIAVIVVYSHVQGEQAVSSCVSAAASKCNANFADTLLRGIACNVLVCLAVWGSMAAKSVGGKIAAVYFPIAAFVICGFEHSVTNMYYLTAGLMANAEYVFAVEGLTVGRALLYSLLPSTIGNVIGGAAVALIYHVVYRGKAKEN